MLVPYMVPEDALDRGYVEIDLCKSVVRSTGE